MLIENLLIKDIASGEIGYISRIIGMNLFEVEFYDEKKPMKWYRNTEQGDKWEFASDLEV